VSSQWAFEGKGKCVKGNSEGIRVIVCKGVKGGRHRNITDACNASLGRVVGEISVKLI
jgi:hypothetical protein